ncbi:hypothetical protein [Streptomyces justiciae]|uniref:hypothetical protein n=1 Tax=Streptomyces justiciae TaxID=2780140 RepID=UPI0021188703|nr:hypothetical protein [Streptomyces justiciae]MCW8384216.1 hypothetical protein [Streptomyces justiciae]
MADFRRQPEWQQQADRHSTLIDPVLTVKPISRFDYTARRQVTAIDHALVFATAGGAYDVYVPPHRPSRTDAATRRYTSVYEVDMGSHPVRLDLQLPSDDDAFAFGATADLTWRVHDPEAFVRSGERDVPTRLTRELQQFARPVSRGYSIEDSATAEAAVQQALSVGSFAAGIGLTVTCVLRLSLDDEAIAHRRRQRALRYETDMLDPEHAYRMRAAQQSFELEALQQRQQQQLVAEKIHFYQYWLQHGGVGAWALHLAAHPEDTQLVINNIHQDQLTFIKTQLELISGDDLEDYQKAESLKQIRQEIDDLLHRRTQPPTAPGGELPAAPGPAYPGETATPGVPYVPGSGPAPTTPYGPGTGPVPGAPYAPGTGPGPVPGAPYGPGTGPGPVPGAPYAPGTGPSPATPTSGYGPPPGTPYVPGAGPVPGEAYPPGNGTPPGGPYVPGPVPGEAYPPGTGGVPGEAYPPGTGGLPGEAYPPGTGAVPGGPYVPPVPGGGGHPTGNGPLAGVPYVPGQAPGPAAPPSPHQPAGAPPPSPYHPAGAPPPSSPYAAPSPYAPGGASTPGAPSSPPPASAPGTATAPNPPGGPVPATPPAPGPYAPAQPSAPVQASAPTQPSAPVQASAPAPPEPPPAPPAGSPAPDTEPS